MEQLKTVVSKVTVKETEKTEVGSQLPMLGNDVTFSHGPLITQSHVVLIEERLKSSELKIQCLVTLSVPHM